MIYELFTTHHPLSTIHHENGHHSLISVFSITQISGPVKEFAKLDF